MTLDLSADEVLATTRAVRKRLDFDRPVERSLIEECLQLAIQAPTGSNRQSWQFVVVADAERRRQLAEIYRSCFEAFYASGRSVVYPDGDVRAERRPKVQESAAYLAANFHRAPWIVVPCQEGRRDGVPSAEQAGWWGSIVPAVWSFMLAARNRGLGTVWTTMHLAREREAAEILGIPYDSVAQVAMIPVAYTVGTAFRPASRLPLEAVVRWEQW